MTIAFATEKVRDAYRDAKALTQMHFAEIAPYQDLFELNPDLEGYEKMERAGALFTITARDDSVLIGYFLMIVRAHPHYKHVKTAVEDMKFVHPHYRGGTGMKLIRYAENLARDLGCKVILQRSKAKSGHGAMYERLGYELMDEVYSKRLDQDVDHGD
jgi:GNAT superfamily N-acetyltransferase